MITSMNAPGKSYRKGISLVKAIQEFGDDAKAEAWFVARRWPDGIRCTTCDSDAITLRKSNRLTQQYHCSGCKANFTVKAGTIMHGQALPEQVGLGLLPLLDQPEGRVEHETPPRPGHHPEAATAPGPPDTGDVERPETARMAGPVEIDETYIARQGAQQASSPDAHAGRGPVARPLS